MGQSSCLHPATVLAIPLVGRYTKRMWWRLRCSVQGRQCPGPQLGWLIAVCWLIGLVACQGATVSGPASPIATLAPAQITPPPTSPVTRDGPLPLTPPVVHPSPTPAAADLVSSASPTTAGPAPYRLTADEMVPPRLRQRLQQFAAENGDLFRWVDDGEVELHLELGDDAPVAQWVYAVVAPFATVQDEISEAALRELWVAGQLSVPAADGPVWTAVWGEPTVAPPLAPAGQLTAQLWQGRSALGSPLGLLPFAELEPALKVIAVDGLSPLQPALANGAWPLTIGFAPAGTPEVVTAFRQRWPALYSNRQPERLGRIALTGVTALTRATAYQMEIFGVDYPGEEVAAVLATADVAHVSHEVSFSPDCPYPNPLGGTLFCARDSYLGLLQFIGVDVVELTGNHLNDYGAENLARSITLYEQAGMQVYGGGRDLAAAAQPLLLDVKGSRVALVGCNPAGPNYAWATATRAGANPCDYAAVYGQIGKLRAEGYIVLVTLQYAEHYDYLPTTSQRADFRALLEAGAHAVSGSQGHHAMTFDLYHGGFIHYGLGNLFFDQMEMIGTRESFVDSYLVYDGRLLSVELWTGLIENYARPRLMSPAERAATLGRVFVGSRYER